jgi:hypothetical protein
LPARNWDKYTLSSVIQAKDSDVQKNPLHDEDFKKQLKEVRAKFFRDGDREKLKKQIKLGRAQLPPIPAPRTLHPCF